MASAGPLPPHITGLQAAASTGAGAFGPVPKVCVVTGGTGFVGQRLVEMLVQRGAHKVRSFDIVPQPAGAWTHPNIEWVVGDIADKRAVLDVCAGADCVWHNAAAVGPFHPTALYDRVNHVGTVNVIDACRAHGVRKVVMSSSPSTRFDGTDVDGATEAQMPALPLPRCAAARAFTAPSPWPAPGRAGSPRAGRGPRTHARTHARTRMFTHTRAHGGACQCGRRYMQEYAGSKARGELKMLDACCDNLMTIAVAPHQVSAVGSGGCRCRRGPGR